MTYRECEKQGQKQIKRPSYSLGRATVFSKEAAAFMIMLDLVKIINIAKFETINIYSVSTEEGVI